MTAPKQKLNINAFQADREVSAGEAIMYCLKTKQHINVNDANAVANAVAELGKSKKLIKETAHSYLTKEILMNSREIILPDGTYAPSQRIDDLCEIWSKNPTLAEQIWTVLIHHYEDMGEWEVKLEEEVMQTLNLEYVWKMTQWKNPCMLSKKTKTVISEGHTEKKDTSMRE
jgi:hypothetical protein